MPEFTGERVVPGQVAADLWNEHFSRYAFAARLAAGKHVLDAGCGNGYGAVELAKTAASVTGLDLSQRVVDAAAALYGLPNLTFRQGDAAVLEFEPGAFDLIVAFEVIEHLSDWRAFLSEAKRVLTNSGQLIVSTPNQTYYAESREKSGPNPFHVHEFSFDEFNSELAHFFPFVRVFLQNHAPCMAFQPVPSSSGLVAEFAAERRPADPYSANFFVAVCSQLQQTDSPAYVYLPATANILREREQHIGLLQDELRQKDAWLQDAKSAHGRLLSVYQEQTLELERRTNWIRDLEQQVSTGRTAIGLLEIELEKVKNVLGQERLQAAQSITSYADKVADLEREMLRRHRASEATESRLESEIQARTLELKRCVDLLDAAEATVVERSNWALSLQTELQEQQKLLRAISGSRWLRLGRRVRLGPDLSNL